MKPLPDLNDVEAMAAIGRTSAMWSARNKALEYLRDKVTELNSAQPGTDFLMKAEFAKRASDDVLMIAQAWTNELQRAEKEKA